MTKDEFKILHSDIIEQYQEIEYNLKRLCSTITGTTIYDWEENMDTVDKDPYGKLIHMIKEVEKDSGHTYIPEEFYARLEMARTKRNFWVHECYIKIYFTGKNVRREDDVKLIKGDWTLIRDLSFDLATLYQQIIKEHPLKKTF